MIGQTAQLSIWYLLGLATGMLVCDRLPFVFHCFTAIFWGVLLWTVAWLTALYLPVGNLRWTAGLIVAGVLLLLACRRVYRGVSKPRGVHVVLAVCVLAGLILVAWFAAYRRVAAGSFDSVALILLGRSMLENGLSPWVGARLGSRSAMIPMLHGAGVLDGGNCLYGLQPVLAVSLALTFCYMAWRVISRICSCRRTALFFSLLACGVLFSSRIMFFQSFYIHDNLAAGAFFFIAVVSLWLALAETNYAWLVPATWALVSCSLVRLEGALYVLIPLALACKELPYGRRLTLTLPVLTVVVVWNVCLFQGVTGGAASFFSPGRLVALLGMMCAFGALVSLSFNRIVDRLAVRRLDVLMLVSLVIALVVILLLEPRHTTSSALAFLKNMVPPWSVRESWWGLTWILMAVAYVLSLGKGGFPFERLLQSCTVAFFLLTLILCYGRPPYRVGWGDSANRMLTHIAPIALLYVFARHASFFKKPQQNS